MCRDDKSSQDTTTATTLNSVQSSQYLSNTKCPPRYFKLDFMILIIMQWLQPELKPDVKMIANIKMNFKAKLI